MAKYGSHYKHICWHFWREQYMCGNARRRCIDCWEEYDTVLSSILVRSKRGKSRVIWYPDNDAVR